MLPKLTSGCMDYDGMSDYDFADDEVVGMEPRSTSKAETLLGMLDITSIPRPVPPPRKGWHLGGGGARRKLREKASHISFAIGGLISGGSKGNDAQLCPTPLSANPDSDSSMSTTSPTFDDAAASVSTLPSVYDSPVTPNPFLRPPSASSKSSRPKLDSHPTRPPSQPKKKTVTLEVPGQPPPAEGERPGHMPRASWHDLPFLDLPPLTPPASTAPPTAPAARSPKSPKTLQKRNPKLPSSGSSLSERTTIQDPRPGRKASLVSSHGPSDAGFGLPLDAQPPPPPLPPPPAKAPSIRLRMPRLGKGRHVQDWLDRADLDRSPSISNRPLPRTADSATLGAPAPQVPPPAATPGGSLDSVHTLTSQPPGPPGTHPALDGPAPHWPLPAGPPSPASTSAARTKMDASNLQQESVLALSASSDDEEGDASGPDLPTILPLRPHRRQSSADSRYTVQANPTRRHSTSQDSSTQTTPLLPAASAFPLPLQPSTPALPSQPPPSPATTAPPVPLPHKRRKRASAASALSASSRAPLPIAAWTSNDETELGSICVAAAERGFAPATTPASPTTSNTSGNAPASPRPKSGSSPAMAPGPRRSSRRALIPFSPRVSSLAHALASSSNSSPADADADAPRNNSTVTTTTDATSASTYTTASAETISSSGARTDGSAPGARAFVAATGVDIAHFPTPPPSRLRSLSAAGRAAGPPPSLRPPLPRENSIPLPAVSPGAQEERQGSDWEVPRVDAPYCSELGGPAAEPARAEGRGRTVGGAPVRGAAGVHVPPPPPIPMGGCGGRKLEGLKRMGTISNVPIYVTGLAEEGEGGAEAEEGVATFVFSNTF